MNVKERQQLNEFMYLWQDIAAPQGSNSAPIVDWQSFTRDMAEFKKASRRFLTGLIFPDESLYRPEDVLTGMQEWLARRQANNWVLDHDSIKCAMKE